MTAHRLYSHIEDISDDVYYTLMKENCIKNYPKFAELSENDKDRYRKTVRAVITAITKIYDVEVSTIGKYICGGEYDDVRREGKEEGYANGYEDGFQEGYRKARDEKNQE